MSGRKQLGWRKSNSESSLNAPLFKFAYQEGMHLISHGEIVKKWNRFVVDLFESQEGFMGMKPLSVKCLREQFDNRTEEFKTFHGWDDGKCKNLSGKDGELSEPHNTIREMLKEQWDEEQKKKVLLNDKESVNENETTVLIRSIGSASKIKRKNTRKIDDESVESPLSTSKSPEAMFAKSLEALSKFSDSMCSLDDSSPELKRSRPSNPIEPNIMSKMMNILKDQSILQLLDDAQLSMRNVNPEDIDLLNDISLELLVDIYCSPSKQFDREYIIQQYKDLKIPILIIHKLIRYFDNVRNNCK
jgi:hypothetical protein